MCPGSDGVELRGFWLRSRRKGADLRRRGIPGVPTHGVLPGGGGQTDPRACLRRSVPAPASRPAADDLADRLFIRGRTNKLWVNEITERRIAWISEYEGSVYCAVVLDTFAGGSGGPSRAFGSAALVTNALSMAGSNRNAFGGKVIHFDLVNSSCGRSPMVRSGPPGPVHGVNRKSPQEVTRSVE